MFKNQKQTEINEPSCVLSWWHSQWRGIKVTLEHINITVNCQQGGNWRTKRVVKLS